MSEKFFTDPSFDFETRTLLEGIHYGAGDIGEMLTAVASITDGDATNQKYQLDGSQGPGGCSRPARKSAPNGTTSGLAASATFTAQFSCAVNPQSQHA